MLKDWIARSTFKEIQGILASGAPADERMRSVIEAIKSASSSYGWVGIYLVARDGLHLDLYPYYLGRRTTHTRISVSQGICGATVQERATLVISDVRRDPRYLACSVETRSEIVVPVFAHGHVIAEVDIDSDEPAVFDVTDRTFLESVAEAIATLIGEIRGVRLDT